VNTKYNKLDVCKTGAIWEKGFLEWLTWQMVKDVGTETSGGTEVKILQVITEPFTKLIIQVIGYIIFFSNLLSFYLNKSIFSLTVGHQSY